MYFVGSRLRSWFGSAESANLPPAAEKFPDLQHPPFEHRISNQPRRHTESSWGRLQSRNSADSIHNAGGY